MARIRTVKPEVCMHEVLFDLEQQTGLPIRFAWVGLWTQCDREGRFRWRPRTLKPLVLPHDTVDFEDVLDALAAANMLIKYEVGGEVYGCIPTWHKHQVINQREAASQIPGPDDQCVHVHARVHISKNVPRSIRTQILSRDGFACVQCGATDDLTIDHIVPRCAGGTHETENLRTLCRACNSARPVQGIALEQDIARARTCTHVQAHGEGKGRERKGREQEGKGKEVSSAVADPPLPERLDVPDFRDAWGRWVKHRSEIKKPLKPTMVTEQIEQFAQWGPERAVAAIKWTIAKGWQGIREPEVQQSTGFARQAAPDI